MNPPLNAGNIVYLLDEVKERVLDVSGFPLLHQVVAIYRNKGVASIVNAYGDYLGLIPIHLIEYASEGPLFNKSNYDIGDIIIWVDGESVYEGKIRSLYSQYARVIDVKKLMPVSHVASVSYWKISEGRKPI